MSEEKWYDNEVYQIPPKTIIGFLIIVMIMGSVDMDYLLGTINLVDPFNRLALLTYSLMIVNTVFLMYIVGDIVIWIADKITEKIVKKLSTLYKEKRS